MPVVYSDPLHEELLGIIESAIEGMQDKQVKERFSKIHERMKLAPKWKFGQSYSNPPVEKKKVIPQVPTS